jgi:plasmid stabilization system protein ParE
MFKVIITAPVDRDFDEQHDWWAENRSAVQAARWYAEFLRALHSLENAPTRRPLAFENRKLPFEARQLTFGLGRRPSHRAIFRVVDDRVVVLRIRSLAQSELSVDEIETQG